MYDLIIIGGGAAGLTSAIYAGRSKISTLVLSKMFGGEIVDSTSVENWPGIKKIAGMELAQNYKEHAEEYGAETKTATVESVEKKNNNFLVKTDEGDFESKTILFAIGSRRRTLNVPGEKEYNGKGVSYCATCDAPMFKDKIVAVIGGGNSAAHSTLLLSEYAKHVYMIYRKGKEHLRAEPITIKLIEENPKTELLLNKNLKEIKGETMITKIVLDDGSQLEVGGVFIEIGFDPNTSMPKSLGAEVDEEGFVKVNTNQQTNVKGVWAAGDFTTATAKFKQLVTAAAEGAIAANDIYKYLKEKR